MTWGIIRVEDTTRGEWETFGERFYFKPEDLRETSKEIEGRLPERSRWQVVDDHGRTVAGGDTRKGVYGGHCATITCEEPATSLATTDIETGKADVHRCTLCTVAENNAIARALSPDDARRLADLGGMEWRHREALFRVADMWDSGSKYGRRAPEFLPSLVQYANERNAARAEAEGEDRATVDRFYPTRTYRADWWAEVLRRFEAGDNFHAYQWGKLTDSQRYQILDTKRATTDAATRRKYERMNRNL